MPDEAPTWEASTDGRTTGYVDGYLPAWTECPEVTCRGAVHRRTVVAPDGDTEMVGFCSSCGKPTG